MPGSWRLGLKVKCGVDEGAVDAPAGEDARDLGYVGLGVSAVDAEGVQFHQLAGVVFIEAFVAAFLEVWAAGSGELGALSGQRVGADALGVVEIGEHGGAVSYGFKQVLKVAKRAGADGVAFIADEVVGHLLVFAQVDVEVIEPEIGHHFLELGVGVDVAGEALGDEVFGDQALGVFESGYGELELRGEAGIEGDALNGPEGLDEAFKVGGLHGGELSDTLLCGEGQDLADGGLIGLE